MTFVLIKQRDRNVEGTSLLDFRFILTLLSDVERPRHHHRSSVITITEITSAITLPKNQPSNDPSNPIKGHRLKTRWKTSVRKTRLDNLNLCVRQSQQ